MKKIIGVIFLFLFMFWFPESYKRWTHTFRLAKCEITYPFQEKWEPSEPISQEILTLFQKPFRYIGKGKQSFVFESDDQKYVLKLYRFERRGSGYGEKIDRKIKQYLNLKDKYAVPQNVRSLLTFESCDIAWKLINEVTGVVYNHLNPKKSNIPPITLIDRLGKKHILDPEKYRFTIQKKAKPFTKFFKQADTKTKTDLVLSLNNMIEELKRKNIANTDNTLHSNFGILEDKVITIDIGNFVIDEDLAKKSASFQRKQFCRLLKLNEENLATVLDEKIQN